MKRTSITRTGFTLLEVLTVVGIIALLVGILVPSLVAARRGARVAVCSAHLRDICNQITAYSFENEGRIPSGPSRPIPVSPPHPYSLVDSTIATSALWMGNGYLDSNGDRHPPQYIGLGLTNKTIGLIGNKVFYCPDDENKNSVAEIPKIGQTGPDVQDMGNPYADGVQAYSSYLYRQLDMLDPSIQQQAQLSYLGSNEFQSVPTPMQASRTHTIDVHALVMDMNSLGTDRTTRSTNHQGRKVNVAHVDGSVITHQNQLQTINSAGEQVPWGSIPGEAFTDLSFASIRHALDRILIAADTGYLNGNPELAPVPTLD